MVEENLKWEAPSLGWVKFNINGASVGDPRGAGIGEILRNYKGDTLMHFSNFVGVCDANYIEVLAIKEAFILFTKILRQSNFNLWVESDSMNVVIWVKNPAKTPSRHRQCMVQIGCLQKSNESLEGDLCKARG
ncbi:hypothetical protein POUND7_008250 [Theobroma cacao]